MRRLAGRMALIGGFTALLAAGPAMASPGEALLLAVRINGLVQGDVATLVHLPDERLAVDGATLDAWGIANKGSGVVVDGRTYYALDDLGIRWRIDPASQTLTISAPPRAFGRHRLTPSSQDAGPGLTPSGSGAFLNYDLQWQRAGGRDVGASFFELGVFNPAGSGSLTGFWNNAGSGREWVRLGTTWTIDLPERMQSLRLGDAIVQPGSWGRAVRFGGIQWASNFATQPNFVTFPLPTVRGEAALPSTLDLYVNNGRRLQSDVPPGPFEITNVPLIIGAGEVQVVVRDLMGRQQTITQPYYVSQRLLRPELHDFSVDVGSVREDYGVASARYGRGVIAATDRLGISPTFTREFRAEVLADRQSVGAGGVWLAGGIGTVSANAAASHGPGGDDGLVGAGFERRTPVYSVSLQGEYSGRNFARIGVLPGYTPKTSLFAQVSFPVLGNGLAVGYGRQDTWEGGESRVISANYGFRLGRLGFAGLYAYHDPIHAPHTTVGVILTHALDNLTHASADVSSRGGRMQSIVQAQRNLPAGEGFGYRVLAGSGDVDRLDAGAYWQTGRTALSAEASRFDGSEAFRFGAAGAVAMTGEGVFLSRRIDGSFAVVKVGDYEGVRVYRDNQEVARTDARGMALITGLRAYQRNPVAIEQADLPLDAEVDTLELRLSPMLKSGVVASFPVRRVRSASFRLVGEDGQLLPPGTTLRIEGDAGEREFTVGFEGRAFVSGLGAQTSIAARWNGSRCRVVIEAGDDRTPVPDLGTLVCKGASH